VDLSIECGHRKAIAQFQARLFARIGRDAHEVVEEIEADLQPLRLIDRDAARRETAEVQMKSHMPPVILRRHVGELDLAHDLDPQMKRVLGCRPALQGQARQLGVNRRGAQVSP
jgi:hypothetical protein